MLFLVSRPLDVESSGLGIASAKEESMNAKLTAAQKATLARVVAAGTLGYRAYSREGVTLCKLIKLGLIVCPDSSTGLCYAC